MERDHVSSSSQIFQNFYLSLDFLFLDWLQCFHHALFIVVYVDGLEHLHKKRKKAALLKCSRIPLEFQVNLISLQKISSHLTVLASAQFSYKLEVILKRDLLSK